MSNSFIIQPNGIPHIPHLWQPTENWDIALEYIDEILRNFVTYNTTLLFEQEWNWSLKYDDKVSLKLWKADGEVYVSYKGNNSPKCKSINEIYKFYGDKKYLDSLLILHHYKDCFFKENSNNIMYQIGFMFGELQYDYDDTIFINSGKTIKPNIIEYNIRKDYKLIITPISSSLLKENMEPYRIFDYAYRFMYYNSKDVLVMKNTVLTNTQIEETYFTLLNKYYELRNKDLDFNWLNLNHEKVKKYLNSFIRNGDFNPTYNNEEYLYAKDSIDNIFRLIECLRDISYFILKHFNATNQEGLVVSKTDASAADKNLIMFKLVNPEFSYKNFNRNG
jgi:hypothetical protein